VILIGSDMDRGLLGLQLSAGILDVVDGLTLYVSAKDRALRFARFLHGRDRAGEAFQEGQPHAVARAWLVDNPKLVIIDVTDVGDSTVEGGHRYFRKSPWVSSDLLMMLRFGLGPEARGLVRSDNPVMWRFPDDYIERLSISVSMARPPEPPPQDAVR
jgi:esterase/lipase superfamily enzyme